MLHMDNVPKDLPNLGILIKLMKMTTSEHDGEALVAVRKANEQLVKFGGDWEALLRGKVTVIGDPFVDMPKPPQRESRTPPPAPSRPKAAPPPYTAPPRPRPTPSYAPPPPPQAQPQYQTTAKTIKNYRAGNCTLCGDWVATGDGLAVLYKQGSPWKLECTPCHTGTAKTAPSVNQL